MASIKLTKDQEAEGYRVEPLGDYVQVWHKNNQIALLINTPDIDKKVQEVVEQRRKDLIEVFEKTGWKG